MINDALTGLELAKYISWRLVDNNEAIEQVTVDFENDVRFVTVNKVWLLAYNF